MSEEKPKPDDQAAKPKDAQTEKKGLWDRECHLAYINGLIV